MRITLRCSLLVLIVAVLGAQTPPGPVTIENKLDTAQARVYVATLRPHMPVPSPNGHATNRVLIYLDNGAMTLQVGGEKVQNIDFHRGQVRWRAASGAYVARNTGDVPIRILEIDLKVQPAGPAPVTKLDPTITDAKHYKVEFENEQVRILRIHYDAHDKGELHEHMLNRVVLYLNNQTGGKADEVRIAGAATHTEENAGAEAADRIAVELK